MTDDSLPLHPGPYGANIFDPREWGGGGEIMTDTITLEFTRVVLAIGVFAIGVELPKAYMRRHWKSLFFFLGPVMIWVRWCCTSSVVTSVHGNKSGLVCIRRVNIRTNPETELPIEPGCSLMSYSD